MWTRTHKLCLITDISAIGAKKTITCVPVSKLKYRYRVAYYRHFYFTLHTIFFWFCFSFSITYFQNSNIVNIRVFCYHNHWKYAETEDKMVKVKLFSNQRDELRKSSRNVQYYMICNTWNVMYENEYRFK